MVSKSWSFTLNNYSGDEEEAIRHWPDVSCLVYGREVSSTGTPHLQGSVTFTKAYRLSGLKKYSPRAHWEVTRNPFASAKYCKKDKDYVVIDNRKNPVNPPVPSKEARTIPLGVPSLDLSL